MLHGLNEILPNQLSKRYEILNQMKSCLEEFDYQRITTPTFEPFTGLAAGWDDYLKEESIQFFNNQGALMTMRPEMTSPIARLVSSRKDQLETPLKLFYTENIFRKSHILRKQEIFQVGIEYLGESSIDVDTKVIEVLIEMLNRINIKNFKIEIGHVENIANKSDQDIESMIHGDYYNLSELPAIGSDEILNKNTYLKQFSEKIDNKYKPYIQYNLGLVKEISYYTGIVFNILVDGVGYIIGTGGRYDSLIKKYGWDIPAIGFAIEFDKLALALEKEQ